MRRPWIGTAYGSTGRFAAQRSRLPGSTHSPRPSRSLARWLARPSAFPLLLYSTVLRRVGNSPVLSWFLSGWLSTLHTPASERASERELLLFPSPPPAVAPSRAFHARDNTAFCFCFCFFFCVLLVVVSEHLQCRAVQGPHRSIRKPTHLFGRVLFPKDPNSHLIRITLFGLEQWTSFINKTPKEGKDTTWTPKQ